MPPTETDTCFLCRPDRHDRGAASPSKTSKNTDITNGPPLRPRGIALQKLKELTKHSDLLLGLGLLVVVAMLKIGRASCRERV